MTELQTFVDDVREGLREVLRIEEEAEDHDDHGERFDREADEESWEDSDDGAYGAEENKDLSGIANETVGVDDASAKLMRMTKMAEEIDMLKKSIAETEKLMKLKKKLATSGPKMAWRCARWRRKRWRSWKRNKTSLLVAFFPKVTFITP